jgi:hypothetical protein
MKIQSQQMFHLANHYEVIDVSRLYARSKEGKKAGVKALWQP